MNGICSVEGCGREGIIVRGMCKMHYQRWRVRGTTDVRPARQCSVDGCERVGKLRRGLCGMHYKRLTSTGTTDPRPSAPAVVCSVDGCDRDAQKRGMCEPHYRRTLPNLTTQCSVEGCDHIGQTRQGMCEMHYQRLRISGTTELSPNLTPAERFAAQVVLRPSGCLEWTGTINKTGYGQISVDRKYVLTHRFAWGLANGPIPDGLYVCHHCDNPPCVQTEPTEGYPNGHLFLGTPADNSADMAAKGRSYWAQQTHCKNGHPFDEVNTYRDKAGRRFCRTCTRESGRKYRSKRAKT